MTNNRFYTFRKVLSFLLLVSMESIGCIYWWRMWEHWRMILVVVREKCCVYCLFHSITYFGCKDTDCFLNTQQKCRFFVGYTSFLSKKFKRIATRDDSDSWVWASRYRGWKSGSSEPTRVFLQKICQICRQVLHSLLSDIILCIDEIPLIGDTWWEFLAECI